jgi:hypothetical protein
MLIQLRQKAAESVRKERDALIAGARREAEIIRRQVTTERAEWQMEQRAATARLAQERAGIRAIPTWINPMVPVKWMDDGRIAVLQSISYNPVRFTFPGWPIYPVPEGEDEIDESKPVERVILEWRAVEANPVKIYIWILFNPTTGAFDMGDCHVAPWSSQLPHAGHGSFCCQPQGVPDHIRSMDDLGRVVSGIARAFREVNLSSLLVPEESWDDEVLAFMPLDCRRFMDKWRDDGPTETDYREFGARIQQADTATTVWGRR